MTFSAWSSTASSNTTINGVNIAENCPAGNTNDMGRNIMADMRSVISTFAETFLDDTSAGAVRTTITAAENTAALSSVASLTPAADRLAYYSGASTAALTTLTSFARTILDDADASAARTTLVALGLTSVSFGTNTISLTITLSDGSSLLIQGGRTTISGNTTASTTFPTPYNIAPVALAVGGSTDTGATGQALNSAPATTTGLSVTNAHDSALTYTWFAIGKA